MQINISGQHNLEITPAIDRYVREKLAKVHKKFNNITLVHVNLQVDKKFQQEASADMHVSKAEIYAEAQAENLYEAIDLLIDKLSRQVVKHKEEMKKRDTEL